MARSRVRRVVAGCVLLVLVAGCGVAEEPDAEPGGPSVASTLDRSSTTTSPAPVPVARSARVVEVVDGDTLDIRLGRSVVERVRIVGINTPEQGECLAEVAARRLADLVSNGNVRLERDVSDRDQYGRLLRHVLVDGQSIGEALVNEGLALSRAYPPDTGRQAALDAAQRRARRAGLGLWAPDACGPASAARVELGRVQADPPGDESEHPNEEWIEILNTGPASVTLTGWGVRDESATHRFEFPRGFTLAGGGAVIVRTGCGPDSATDLHWCVSGSAVWNNDGDTAFLVDPRGNVADQRPI